MFCSQAFNHVDVIVENQHVQMQPCNVWSGQKYESRLSNQTYFEWVSSKQKILKDKFTAQCDSCKNAESIGMTSRRLSCNSFTKQNNLPTNSIASVGLRYGTLCNAKCMICDHTRSTGWVKDALSLGINVDDRYKMKKKEMPDMQTIFSNFDLSQLKFVEFHGGEPLLHTYPEEFLECFGNEALTLKINTNGSVFPSPRLQKLFATCKQVDILLSIDDIGGRFELLRHPIKWKDLLSNIQGYKKLNVRLAVTPTISALNIWYFDEFLQWVIKNCSIEIYPQFVVGDKVFLDIKNLHSNIKQKLLNRFTKDSKLHNSIRQQLLQEGQDLTQDLINYIESLDKLRGTNFQQQLGKWYEIIQDTLHR